jgi:hypothetical protein
MAMADSFFTTSDGDWFQPTDHCRGPWDPDACHAGPPAGLMARAVEELVPHHRLTRLTVDLSRPIPHAGFRVVAATTRVGRSAATSVVAIVDGDGTERAAGRALHLTAGDGFALPTVSWEPPNLDASEPGSFPLRAANRHPLPAFNGPGVEVRYPPGEVNEPGPTTVWMRTVPLLPDEAPSPFQRICPLADCGNAISRNAETDAATYMNPDLTLVLHRDPEGDWLGSSAVSRWEPTGIGMSDALLFDTRGAVGRAVQTLLIAPTVR